ncbi:LOW QUALITY PROTEIN: uncharacterized protein [Bemisia tabaci]|uniref:LOW QUALITY PROTEIN: uncharacterized protein n=1 Tax=Bemisia tabaci TaxID=7038 RepID=UPI003B27D27F
MISQVFLLLAGSCLLASAQYAPYYPYTVTSQYHSQDELGQYTYGHSGGPSAKHETKTADGITQGGYSYIDAYGLLQSVSYVSDPVNGFRAAGTNFPMPVPAFVAHPAAPGAVVPIAEAVAPAETPEVVAAKAHLFNEQAAAVAKLAHSRRRRSAVLPYAAALPAALPVAHAAYPYAYAAPAVRYAAPAVAAPAVTYAAPYAAAPAVAYAAPAVAAPAVAYAAPAVIPAPVAAPTSVQHHSQDELGQYKYGYANQDSAKEELKTADGITRGSYTYRDAYGLPQTVSYIADPVNGFRAAGTNLPVAPVA